MIILTTMMMRLWMITVSNINYEGVGGLWDIKKF